MKKWLMAVLLGTFLVLGACGGGNGDDSANNAGNDNATNNEAVDSAAGEEVYQQNCASCHGDDLSGGVGPSLEAVGSDLSVDEIKDVIENGQGSMPAGLVEGEDEDAVAEWLATHE